MAFRISRGIWQFQKEDGTYESKYKLATDGRIVETDASGNELSTFGGSIAWSAVTGKPSTFTPSAHNHDDRYYTESEVNTLLAGKQAAGSYLTTTGKAADSNLLDGIDSGSFLRSDANDSFSGLLTATASNWYIYGLGARGASAGAYGIGNRAGDSYRQMTFHVPNLAAYANSGTIPSFGWYSNGAVQLMKLDSDSGNLWTKGSIEADGRIYADNGLHVRGDWVRVNGTNGLYFESYGGGWNMSDSTWIRAYNNKSIYTTGTIQAGRFEVSGTDFVDYSVGIHSGSDFVDGTLVKTTIQANVVNGASFIMEVTGKSYVTSHSPFSLILQGYIYNNTFIATSAISNGTSFPGPIKIFEFGGQLCFWWPRWGYWNSFQVKVRDANGNNRNQAYFIGNSTEPDSTKKVSVTPFQTWSTYHFSQSSVNNWNTAYGWGNHASAGYITSSGSISGNAATATKLQTARSIALGGDVSGSANFDGSGNITITATVADDSHNHVISNIDGLQAALDGKQAAGSYAAASHTHTSLGSVNFNNGDLTNINSIQIGDPGPNEGLIFNGGNLWKIYESPNNLTTNSSGNLQFVRNTTRVMTLDTSNNVYFLGAITASGYNSSSWDEAYSWGNHADAGYLKSVTNISGNAATATKLATARSIALSGDVTGSANFDGSANITITATVADDSHNHVISNIDGLQAALDGKQAAGSYVLQLSNTSSPNYQDPSSRRVDPNASNPTNEHYAITTFGNGGNVTGQLATHFVNGQLYSRGYNSSWSAWRKVWDSANFDPNSKANSSHTHTIANVTGLQAALDGKQASGSYAAASHTHTIANVTGLQAALDDKQVRGSYLTSESDTLATVTSRGNTTSGSINVNGNILLTGTATTTNQGRMIDFTGFDKEGTTDFSDRAYIQHTTNTGGHSGSVLVISSQNDSGDGIAFLTNASSKLKHNSNNIATENWVSAQGYLTSIPAHTHTIANVTGLQSALDGKQAAGSYAAASHEHDRSFITDSRGASRAPSYYDDRYAQWDFQNASDTGAGGDSWHGLLTVSKWSVYDNSHRQEQLAFTGNDLKRRTATSDAAWGGWKTILDSSNFSSWAQPAGSYAAASHTHTIANVTGLQTALDGKQAAGSYAAASHTHDDRYYTKTDNDNLFLRKNADTTLTATLFVDAANGGSIAYSDSAGTYIPRPHGGSYKTTTNAVTGAINIALPGATPSDMLSFWVDIYDYAGTTNGESFSIYVYGYAYSTTSPFWTNVGAVILSDRTDRDFTVRFGYDGTNHVVCIGETNSTWNYPQVVVRDFQAGYSAASSTFDDNWSVSFVTTLPSIGRTASANYPVSKSAYQLVNTRTINGTNFNGTNNVITSYWGTGRTITIGNSGKIVNGSQDMTWTLADIGAAAFSHTHTIDDVTGLQNALDGKQASGSYAASDHNHTYNVNNAWLRDNGDNANVKLYGNTRQMAFRTDGTTEYATGVGGYPFAWMYGGDAATNRRMLMDTSGNLWTATYGWLHDYFQRAGSYAAASHTHTPSQVGLGNVSNSAQVTTANNSSLNSDSRNTRGVTRLYRRDSNSDYSVQTYWTGARWRLYGYQGDSNHADTHVGYADSAGSATSATTATSAASATNATNANRLDNYGINYGSDWNTWGVYGKLVASSYHNASGANRPPTYTYGSFLSFLNAGADSFQIAIPENQWDGTGKERAMHFRSAWNGTWSSWRQVVDIQNNVCDILASGTSTLIVRQGVGYNQPFSSNIEIHGSVDDWAYGKFRFRVQDDPQSIPVYGAQFRIERFSVNTGWQLLGMVPRGSQDLEWQGEIFAGLSDQRVKENVVSLTDGVATVQQINPVEFDWKPVENVSEREGHDIGFIAQQLEEIVPTAVYTRNDGYKTVKYEKVVPILVQAIKEQQSMIELLSARLDALEQK